MDRDRQGMLDPGVTAIALRALHQDGHYPFVDAWRRRRARRWGSRLTAWLTMAIGRRPMLVASAQHGPDA